MPNRLQVIAFLAAFLGSFILNSHLALNLIHIFSEVSERNLRKERRRISKLYVFYAVRQRTRSIFFL